MQVPHPNPETLPTGMQRVLVPRQAFAHPGYARQTSPGPLHQEAAWRVPQWHFSANPELTHPWHPHLEVQSRVEKGMVLRDLQHLILHPCCLSSSNLPAVKALPIPAGKVPMCRQDYQASLGHPAQSVVEEAVTVQSYQGCRANSGLLERRKAPQRRTCPPSHRDSQPAHQAQMMVVKARIFRLDYSTSLNLAPQKWAVKTDYPASVPNLVAALKVQQIVLLKPPNHEASLDPLPLSEERNLPKILPRNPGCLANPNRLDLAPIQKVDLVVVRLGRTIQIAHLSLPELSTDLPVRPLRIACLLARS